MFIELRGQCYDFSKNLALRSDKNTGFLAKQTANHAEKVIITLSPDLRRFLIYIQLVNPTKALLLKSDSAAFTDKA
jgi:hypothetical protein